MTASGGNDSRMWQPTSRLNILVVDPVDDDNGIMGDDSGLIQNTNEIIGSAPTDVQKVSNLNRLLAQRGSKYGWGWNKFHQNDHPLLRKQRKENELVIRKGSGDALTKYNLPPVSMKGRPMLINIDKRIINVTGSGGQTAATANATFKVTNTNENIFFSQRDLNQLANKDLRKIFRSADSVFTYVNAPNSGRKLNWVLYTQNVFPSTRNEFISGTKRIGYDNKFWRDDQGNSSDWSNSRVQLGTGSVPRNSYGYEVSQSAWVLDPCVGFLTRSTALATSNSDFRRNDNAGELQNTYYRTFLRSIPNHMRPAALYARPHTLGTFRSVVSPTGPHIAETGSLTGASASFEYAK